MKLTKEEFIEQYAKNSKLTIEQVLELFEAKPCSCQEGNCRGWQMTSKKPLELYNPSLDDGIMFP